MRAFGVIFYSLLLAMAPIGVPRPIFYVTPILRVSSFITVCAMKFKSTTFIYGMTWFVTMFTGFTF